MTDQKIKIGIIGPGNIGIDLLKKILKSPMLECSIFMGRNKESEGISIANSLGIRTTTESISFLKENPDLCDIVFDATSAEAHLYHAPILKHLNKFVIDLTPAKVGSFCIPALNLDAILSKDNINLITCGGQASIPLAYALKEAVPNISYIEAVATIAARSAGIGTRKSVDEYTLTTGRALSYFTGIKHTKSIILLNPTEPPINMKNTLYAMVQNPDMDLVKQKVDKMVKKIQEYVPNYYLTVDPIYDGEKITLSIQVLGQGDYLPAYAGNLDIITCAAVHVAEAYARKKIEGTLSK
ncbi:MAG: acetaldehyde dehydrogenase (acetylating) [Brevinema sp.]